MGGQQLDREQTTELIAAASNVLDWLDGLLPEDARTPPCCRSGPIELTRMLDEPGVDLLERPYEP